MTAGIPSKVGKPQRSTFDEHLAELSHRIEAWLEESRRSADSLKEIIHQVRQEPPDREPGQAAPGSDGGGSREALFAAADFAGRIASFRDQSGLLSYLMDTVASLCHRAVLLAVKRDAFIGCSSRGMHVGFNARTLRISAASDNLLARTLADGTAAREMHGERSGNEELDSLLGSRSPRTVMAVPLWVKGRVAAVLYADSGEREEIRSPEAIEVVAALASLALESLPIRVKYPPPPQAASTVRVPRTGIELGRASSAVVLDDVAVVSSPPPVATTTEVSETAGGQPPAGEEEIAQRDARRFAHLLASELLLYNEAQIEEGRLKKDLYERLKDGIERSREMYEQRVSPRLSGAADYLREELVRVLAAGDESAINLPWP